MSALNPQQRHTRETEARSTLNTTVRLLIWYVCAMTLAAPLRFLWPRRTMDVALECLTLALFPIGAFVLGGRAKVLFPFSVYGALAAALPMHQYFLRHSRLGSWLAYDPSAWEEAAYLSALGLAMAFVCRSAAWLRQRQFRRPRFRSSRHE